MTRNKKSGEPRPHRFGWCVTGHHDRCRVSYVNTLGDTRSCECSCHA